MPWPRVPLSRALGRADSEQLGNGLLRSVHRHRAANSLVEAVPHPVASQEPPWPLPMTSLPRFVETSENPHEFHVQQGSWRAGGTGRGRYLQSI